MEDTSDIFAPNHSPLSNSSSLFYEIMLMPILADKM